MIVVKDVVNFIKKPDDFILKNPKKAALYSIAFKIIGISFLIIVLSNPICFGISSICSFSASLYIDNKILKNFEPLFFGFVKKWINYDPEKVGVYIGRILEMIYEADPALRTRGIYRGFFLQKNS